MPTILEVSTELLKRTRRAPPSKQVTADGTVVPSPNLESRVALLEDNERRAAELDAQMADQLAQLTAAATALHAQNRRLAWGLVTVGVVAVVAIILALVR